MLFNPQESIDFNGNTGPFIQYTHARIRSILRKAEEKGLKEPPSFKAPNITINPKEKQLLHSLYAFPDTVNEAAGDMSPARIANYVYELAKEFNQFYHDHSVLNEPDKDTTLFRLSLSALTAHVIKAGMSLLGIRVPDRM